MEKVRQRIVLDDLRFFAYHGYYPEEQLLGNEYTVAIHVELEKQEKAEDDLSRTVNYETLYDIAKTEMQRPRKLLETVAEKLLDRIRLNFPFVSEIEVSVTKHNPPFGGDHAKAAVTLIWTR